MTRSGWFLVATVGAGVWLGVGSGKAEPTNATHVARADSLENVGTIAGPQSGESGWDLFIDGDGNLFTVGHHGGLDLDRDGIVDRSADGIDPMYIKSGPDGRMQWLFTPTAPGYDNALVIASDRQGGMFAAGHVKQPGLRLNSERTLRSSGTWDAFAMRIDPEGRVLWTRQTSGDSIESFRAFASDTVGNLYAIGGAAGYGPIGFEGFPDRIASEGGRSRFLVSYDPGGEPRWLRSWTDHHEPLDAIAVQTGGDLWMAGAYSRQGVDLDQDGVAEIEGAGGMNAYLARFDTSGNFLDHWPIVALEGGERRGVGIVGIEFTHDRDVVVGGTLIGAIDFDGDGRPDARSDPDLPAAGFLARYSPAGELRWARTHVIDRVWRIATDGRRFALAGFYRGERDLNQDGRIDAGDRLGDFGLDSDDPSSDMLVVVTDEEGRYAQHLNAPGPGHDHARGVAFIPGRSAIWVTGFFQIAADFDGSLGQGEGYIECDALGDIFWARYRLRELPDIVLTVEPEQAGATRRAVLAWSGARSTDIDIYRDGARVTNTANDGTHRDALPDNAAGDFEYQVCEGGTQICSNRVTVMF